MGRIYEMPSKRIPKPSVKLHEQTANCHIAEDDGDPHIVKQAFQ